MHCLRENVFGRIKEEKDFGVVGVETERCKREKDKGGKRGRTDM